MRIHALTTGTTRVKHAFLFAKTGIRRQLDLFMPGPWSDPLPIHCWAIEHEDRVILVDTGEVSSARNIPFARFDISPERELPGALEKAGLSSPDVGTVVLTHMHADHMDGAVHVRGPVLVHDRELEFAHSFQSRFFQRVLRQPLPTGVDFQPIASTAAHSVSSPRAGRSQRTAASSPSGRPAIPPGTSRSSASTTRGATSCWPETRPTHWSNFTPDVPTRSRQSRRSRSRR